MFWLVVSGITELRSHNTTMTLLRLLLNWCTDHGNDDSASALETLMTKRCFKKDFIKKVDFFFLIVLVTMRQFKILQFD